MAITNYLEIAIGIIGGFVALLLVVCIFIKKFKRNKKGELKKSTMIDIIGDHELFKQAEDEG